MSAFGWQVDRSPGRKVRSFETARGDIDRNYVVEINAAGAGTQRVDSIDPYDVRVVARKRRKEGSVELPRNSGCPET